MKTKRIKIPIYNGRLIIIKVDDWEPINIKYGYKLGRKHNACVFKDFNDEVVVVFKDDPTPSIIAHEAVHIVNHFFKDRGIDLDTENDEPYAYFLGWIVVQLNKFSNKLS